MSIHRDPADHVEYKFGNKIYAFEAEYEANIARSLWQTTNGGNDGLEDALTFQGINFDVVDEE